MLIGRKETYMEAMSSQRRPGGARCGVYSVSFKLDNTARVKLEVSEQLEIVVVVSGQLLAELDSQCYEVLPRRRSCSP